MLLFFINYLFVFKAVNVSFCVLQCCLQRVKAFSNPLLFLFSAIQRHHSQSSQEESPFFKPSFPCCVPPIWEEAAKGNHGRHIHIQGLIFHLFINISHAQLLVCIFVNLVHGCRCMPFYEFANDMLSRSEFLRSSLRDFWNWSPRHVFSRLS